MSVGDGLGAFPARLLTCRRLAGLSQEELADLSGLSVRTISNLERGRTRKPYLNTRQRLADALGLKGQARNEFLAARRPRDPAMIAADRTTTAMDLGRSPGRRCRHGIFQPQCPHYSARRDQLAALSQVLCGHPSATAAALISGTAGVGKTALALRWAHDAAERFPDGQLYVDLRGYGGGHPVAAAEALAGLLRALGLAGLDIPDGTEERAAAYRSLLAGKRVLVVLDNACRAAQVRPLLPGTAGCAVVVTSRDSLAGLVAREGASRLELVSCRWRRRWTCYGS